MSSVAKAMPINLTAEERAELKGLARSNEKRASHATAGEHQLCSLMGQWAVARFERLVKDLITPLIAAIVGKPDFSAIEFMVNGSKFPIGDFINALVSFILIAAAVYFFIVLPMNTIPTRMRRGEVAPDPTTKKCPECLSDVPVAARRCAF